MSFQNLCYKAQSLFGDLLKKLRQWEADSHYKKSFRLTIKSPEKSAFAIMRAPDINETLFRATIMGATDALLQLEADEYKAFFTIFMQPLEGMANIKRILTVTSDAMAVTTGLLCGRVRYKGVYGPMTFFIQANDEKILAYNESKDGPHPLLKTIYLIQILGQTPKHIYESFIRLNGGSLAIPDEHFQLFFSATSHLNDPFLGPYEENKKYLDEIFAQYLENIPADFLTQADTYRRKQNLDPCPVCRWLDNLPVHLEQRALNEAAKDGSLGCSKSL